MLVRRDQGPWAVAEPGRFVAETEFQALVVERFDQILTTESDAPVVVVLEVAEYIHGLAVRAPRPGRDHHDDGATGLPTREDSR